MNRLTVSAKCLEYVAKSIEANADDLLHAWIVLGDTDRYSEEKEKVRDLRYAITIKNIADRRRYLAEKGL